MIALSFFHVDIEAFVTADAAATDISLYVILFRYASFILDIFRYQQERYAAMLLSPPG